MRLKARRFIVGVVLKVEMPCGCYALASAGKAVLKGNHDTGFNLTKLPVHDCKDWKRHKYYLAELENDLPRRGRAWLRRQRCLV